MNRENVKLIEFHGPTPASVEEALLEMLHEEKRSRIEDYGLDALDVAREHKNAVARLKAGLLSVCECCSGMISKERAFSENMLFTTTCKDECSYALVMEAIEKKIDFLSADLGNKKVCAMQDLNSNEQAKGDIADSFNSQDINVTILAHSEKLLERLLARKNFLVLNPTLLRVCPSCAGEIPLDRLINNPEAGLCRACKPSSRDTRTNARSCRRVPGGI